MTKQFTSNETVPGSTFRIPTGKMQLLLNRKRVAETDALPLVIVWRLSASSVVHRRALTRTRCQYFTITIHGHAAGAKITSLERSPTAKAAVSLLTAVANHPRVRILPSPPHVGVDRAALTYQSHALASTYTEGPATTRRRSVLAVHIMQRARKY